MDSLFAYFGTDEINRQGFKIPCDVIAKSLEAHSLEALENGLPQGTPMHFAHDLHRVRGWASNIGILLTGDLAAHVGFLQFPDTKEEWEPIYLLQQVYLTLKNKKGSEVSRKAFVAKLVPTHLDEAQVQQCDQGVLKHEGIARKVFPGLFDMRSGHVDKDGLTKYQILIERFEYVHPGVFRDRDSGLLVFAHRFFRRSLSHQNYLNEYFLQLFDSTARSRPDLELRLRLDPDILGDAESYLTRFELEYWYGPPFDNKVSSIKSGVAVHHASESQKILEGIEATQFWWKEPETRIKEDGAIESFRTLEAEELVAEPSYGLALDVFGCRYIHSEYQAASSCITHFDGAIRAYTKDSYLRRKDQQMNRAGKHAEYTKVFRIDGALGVAEWKSLAVAYYRGNQLVPEYLGALPPTPAPPSTDVNASRVNAEFESDETSIPLFVMVAYQRRRELDDDTPGADRLVMMEGGCLPYVEYIEDSRLSDLAKKLASDHRSALLKITDRVLNVPRIELPIDDEALRTEILQSVCDAIAEDVNQNVLAKISLAFSWPWNGLLITMSISGSCRDVTSIVVACMKLVNPTLAPSTWIQGLKDAVSALKRRVCDSTVASQFVSDAGVLSIPHEFTRKKDAVVQFEIPLALAEALGFPRAGSTANSQSQ